MAVSDGTIMVPTERIVLDGRLREDYGDIESLAKSIEREGLLNALVIDRRPGKEYRLVAGARRLMAVKLLGWESVPCRLFEGDESLVELEENALRENFTTEEIGRYAIANWASPKYPWESGTQRDILGRRIGVSGYHLEKCKQIVEFMDANPVEAAQVKKILQSKKRNVSAAMDFISGLGRNNATSQPTLATRKEFEGGIYAPQLDAAVFIDPYPKASPEELVKHALCNVNPYGAVLLQITERSLSYPLLFAQGRVAAVHTCAAKDTSWVFAELVLFANAATHPALTNPHRLHKSSSLAGAVRRMLSSRGYKDIALMDTRLLPLAVKVFSEASHNLTVVSC